MRVVTQPVTVTVFPAKETHKRAPITVMERVTVTRTTDASINTNLPNKQFYHQQQYTSHQEPADQETEEEEDQEEDESDNEEHVREHLNLASNTVTEQPYNYAASYYEWNDGTDSDSSVSTSKNAKKNIVTAVDSKRPPRRLVTAVIPTSVTLLKLVYDDSLPKAKSDIKKTLQTANQVNHRKELTLSELLNTRYGTGSTIAVDVRANINALVGTKRLLGPFSEVWPILRPILTRKFPVNNTMCLQAARVNEFCPKSTMADEHLRRASACFATWSAVGNYDVERCVISHGVQRCSGRYGVEGCYQNLVLAERQVAAARGSWYNYFKWIFIPTWFRNNTKEAHVPFFGR